MRAVQVAKDQEKINKLHLNLIKKFASEEFKDSFKLQCMVGQYYQQRKMFKDTNEVAKFAYPAALAKNGLDHPETFIALHLLGVSHKELGNYEKALPLFQKAVDRGKKPFGQVPLPVFQYGYLEKADCLLRMKKVDQAIETYLEGLKWLKKNDQGPIQQELGLAYSGLIKAYTAKGDSKMLKQWQKKLHDLKNPPLPDM